MARKSGKLAPRYARALLKATREMIGEEGLRQATLDIAQSLQRFVQIWKEDPQLSFYIISPMYPLEERRAALQNVARHFGLSEVAERFLVVVFERDRIDSLSDIVNAYEELAFQQSGLVPVAVVTAKEIDGEERGEIERTIAGRITGTPIFDWKVDSSILGGLVVMFEGKVLDGSLRRRLEVLKEQLIEGSSL